MNQVEWGKEKIFLLFLALVCQQLADHAPLTIGCGVVLKEGAEIVWPAFAGLFAYLLKPASKVKENAVKDSSRS